MLRCILSWEHGEFGSRSQEFSRPVPAHLKELLTAFAQNVGRYCESAYKTESSAGTTKVVTGCGDTVLNC
jgi:hypothetical protein